MARRPRSCTTGAGHDPTATGVPRGTSSDLVPRGTKDAAGPPAQGEAARASHGAPRRRPSPLVSCGYLSSHPSSGRPGLSSFARLAQGISENQKRAEPKGRVPGIPSANRASTSGSADRVPGGKVPSRPPRLLHSASFPSARRVRNGRNGGRRATASAHADARCISESLRQNSTSGGAANVAGTRRRLILGRHPYEPAPPPGAALVEEGEEVARGRARTGGSHPLRR